MIIIVGITNKLAIAVTFLDACCEFQSIHVHACI